MAVVLKKGYPVPVLPVPVTSAREAVRLVAVRLTEKVPFSVTDAAVGAAPSTRSKVIIAGCMAKRSSEAVVVLDVTVDVLSLVLVMLEALVVVVFIVDNVEAESEVLVVLELVVDVVLLIVVVVKVVGRMLVLLLVVVTKIPGDTVVVVLAKGVVGTAAFEARPDNNGGPGIV